MITDVIDTGIGMKTADLQRLFKFFGKIKQVKMINKGGMGLGLTISKMIVKELGGDINVTSEYNRGSQFSFSVDISEKKTVNDEDQRLPIKF